MEKEKETLERGDERESKYTSLAKTTTVLAQFYLPATITSLFLPRDS